MLAVSYRLVFAAALGLGAIATASTARGGEITAQLDYQAASGCPLAAEFEALVVRRLGRDPFRSDAAESVVVRIEFAGAELLGRFEWKDASGRWLGDRVFSSRSRDCRELFRVMGFTLALQFQLMATDALPESHPTDAAGAGPARPGEPSEPATLVAPLPLRAEIAPETQPASARSRPSVAIGGGAAVGIGFAPSAIALGRLFGTLAWSHVALELGAELSVPSSVHSSGGGGFSEQLLFGSVAACAKGSVLSACLLTRYGQIRVVGEGVEQPLSSSGALLQSGVRLSVAHSLGRAEVAAHVGGVAQITHAVVTQNSIPIWSAPRVGADLGMDIAIRF